MNNMYFIYKQNKKINTIIGTCILVALLVTSFSFIPITRTGEIQLAQAQIATISVGGNGTIQQTLSAASNKITAAAQSAFYIKEFTLDGILNGLAKMVLKSMTQSILTWINSGFQGSPAFVTDLKQFMLDRLDQVAGDFIYNNPDLNFLCSPFQLDVKIALATAYQQQRDGGLESAQCTLSDVTDNVEGFLNGSFNEGGWASWFEVSQNTVNTPTGAYLAAEGEMYARIADEEGRTIKELEWGSGFLSFKVCSEAQKASGNVQNCQITTPGRVIADQINKSLGAGQDALIAADEIDEIIGAFFAQLAKQAITGINGLLGLGASSFSENSFGDNKDKSFLEALNEETPAFGNPFEDSIQAEEENIDLQNKIITVVNQAQQGLESAKSQYGSCMTVSMPANLIEQRANAIIQLQTSSTTIALLNEMNDNLLANTDPYQQLDIIDTYNTMLANGELLQATDNITLRTFIQNDLKKMVESLEEDITKKAQECEGAQN